jgi:phage terminase large subunit GpA-like protein
LFVHVDDNLIVNTDHPHRSFYRCSCGHHISDAERILAIDAGQWIATNDKGDHPGFHVDAFISKMMSYEAIAEDRIERDRKNTETARKDYSNLVCGRPFRYRGDAPDHEKLMLRREEWMKQGHIPPKGLIFTAAADVQMRGIWLEVLAHGSNRETWLVDARYLDGDTSDPNGRVYQELKRHTIDCKFPDAFGGHKQLDALAIDTGYRSNAVLAFIRKNQRLHPDTGYDLILGIKGVPGWGKPPISQPTLVDLDLSGQKVKQGGKIWKVGTWPLKADFYSFLRQEGIKSGAPRDPDGYCHFGMWVDELYFRQLVGDRLEKVKVHGKDAGQRWAQIKNNHFHDCRIYNLAMAEYLGISQITPEQWRALAFRRGLPAELSEQTLFSQPQSSGELPAPATTQITPPSQPSDQQQPPESGWLGRTTDGWLKR